MRLVVFDAAGTLLEVAGSVGGAYAECARRAGAEIGGVEEAIERGFAEAMRAAPPLAFGGLEGAPLEAAERVWWRAVARRALAAAGLATAELDVERFFDLAWRHFAGAAAWRVPEDVRPALRELRARGVPLAVFSNWDQRLPPLLDALGLGGFFARVLVSSALPAAKPDPAAFDAARRALEAGAPAWRGAPVLVGDRLDHDVAPAVAQGWGAVWLDRAGRGGRAPAGAERIGSLSELPARLAALGVS